MGREMAINWIYHNSIGKLAINLMKCAVNVTQIKPRHHSKRGGGREEQGRSAHTHTRATQSTCRVLPAAESTSQDNQTPQRNAGIK